MPDLDAQSLKALQGAIAKDAPTLAKLLDGANAAVAVSALGKSLLDDAQATLADVLTAAKVDDPVTHLKISEAEQEGELRLRQSQANLSLSSLDTALAAGARQAQTDEAKIEAADIANARERQVRLHDQTNSCLAYIVTAGFFLLVVVLIFFGSSVAKDEGVKSLLFALAGVIGTGWANIISFYFGSSVGSMQKSQMLNAALQRKGA